MSEALRVPDAKAADASLDPRSGDGKTLSRQRRRYVSQDRFGDFKSGLVFRVRSGKVEL